MEKEFIKAVETMRDFQKQYFKERADPDKKKALLLESKEWEKKVDSMLLSMKDQQVKLF